MELSTPPYQVLLHAWCCSVWNDNKHQQCLTVVTHQLFIKISWLFLFWLLALLLQGFSTINLMIQALSIVMRDQLLPLVADLMWKLGSSCSTDLVTLPWSLLRSTDSSLYFWFSLSSGKTQKAVSSTHLRSESDVVVPHEARVGVVFDVLALDVMFQVEERFTGSVGHLHHTHLHDVHLRRRQALPCQILRFNIRS